MTNKNKYIKLSIIAVDMILYFNDHKVSTRRLRSVKTLPAKLQDTNQHTKITSFSLYQ
jgi:hypothetical protein